MFARRTLRAVALAACIGVVVAGSVAAARASRLERPVADVTAFVGDLRQAARLAEEARTASAWIADRNATRCAQVSPAASRLAAAAGAARSVFERYRGARTRYGTQEEIGLIAEIGRDLREARASLARVAGEPGAPSAKERTAAEKEIGVFQQVVAVKLADRLGVEGLAEVLTAPSFRAASREVSRQVGSLVRKQAEAELKRLVGLRIRLDVPLRQQVRDFLEAELSRAISRLAIAAGPAGIVVTIFGRRIFSLVGAKLREALRTKGDLDRRTAVTVTGFGSLRRRLNELRADSPLDRVRPVIRDAQRALGATGFLEGDLRRARRNDLLAKVAEAGRALRRTLALTTFRFVLDSDLVGEDFGIAVRYTEKVRADAERLARKLGCTVELPPSDPGPPPRGRPKEPTAATCPPPFPMEVVNFSGVRVGEFTVTGPTLQRTYPDDPGRPYSFKCLYFNPGDRGENFVVFVDVVPPDVPGTIPSGNCSGSRPDTPPSFHSRTRYLSVSGGTRREGNRAVGGDAKIVRAALTRAEAQRVGLPCVR